MNLTLAVKEVIFVPLCREHENGRGKFIPNLVKGLEGIEKFTLMKYDGDFDSKQVVQFFKEKIFPLLGVYALL